MQILRPDSGKSGKKTDPVATGFRISGRISGQICRFTERVLLFTSVSDPGHFYTDPDPTQNENTDPDPSNYIPS